MRNTVVSVRAGARIAALMLAVSSTTIPARAQAVSATSGSPQAIARIREAVAVIEREAPAYRQTTHDVYDFSLEGGELKGFYRGGELRKLGARLFGESWRGSEEYYFAGGRLIFIHVVHKRYAEPFEGGGEIAASIEHRFYFDDGRLIRVVRTQSPARGDFSLFDPEVPALLRNAELFAACAAATGDDPPQCTAPER